MTCEHRAVLLIIFDIDGTLVQSVQADSRCYTQALREALNLENGHHWARCRDTTDPGILGELFCDVYGRGPTGPEVERFQRCFFALLERHCMTDTFAPVPGAGSMLAAMVDDPAIAVAYGTGAWLRSAELKMSSAGMPLSALPGATGDDAVSREEIVRAAIRRAHEYYQVPEFERLVYVGDGAWDVRACRKLEMPFVGVGDRAGRASMKREGASHLIRDFRDLASFRALLEAAGVPS